jgi:hypothetical protein
MVGTYIDMQDRIADEIDDSDVAPQIRGAIQSAIQLHRSKRFFFNQKIATFYLTAGQEYYGAADLADIPRLIAIDAMAVDLDGAKVAVTPADFATIDANQSGVLSGDPYNCAYYNEQIRMYPIPNARRAVTMAYHCQLPALVNDTDTNAWMTDGELLIRQCAKRLLAMDSIHEPEIAQAAAPLEQEALDMLQAETRKRMSNDRLRTELPGLIRHKGFSILTAGFRG